LVTKCGIAYDATKTRITDGRPPTLRRHCEVSLRRLRSEYVELLYLHAPDPKVPLVESAAELGRLKAQGKALAIGLSNATLAQICEFHAVCPLAAVQLKFNLLQREIEEDIVPWCQKTGIGVVVYWPLMKGLLAGSLARHHPFDPADPRLRYPIFQSPLWEANQDFVDALRGIATDLGRTVAQIAINWIIHRPGISAALCGAKRPAQIIENAGAMGWRLDTAALQEIELAYRRWQNKTRDTKIS
jgi:aryl-alcohol dehydrogenase-like predicted oxidoreductase